MSYILINRMSKILPAVKSVADNALPHYTNIREKASFSLKIDDKNKMENWKPCDELLAQYKNIEYAVIILNTAINLCCSQQVVLNLWNQAKVRIVVDGGADRWFQWLTSNKQESDQILNPDLITGDMDSISENTSNYFQNRGTKVIITPDQDDTDYTKALKEFKVYCSTHNIDIDTIYVLVDISGRFDHVMANINTLFISKGIFESAKIIQIASKSLTWLMSKGYHSISIPTILREKQAWCSLMPIGSPCSVTSTGLKWNLQNAKMSFGHLISVSNTYNGSPIVTIETDGPVLWSMCITTVFS